MTKGPKSPRAIAIGMLLFATIFWGLSFPIASALYNLQGALLAPGQDTITLSAFSLIARFWGAAVVIAVTLRSKLFALSRNELKLGIGLGVVGGLGMLAQMDGLQHTTVATSAFLTQLYCVLIPFHKSIGQRKIPSLRIVASVVLAVAGFAAFSGISLTKLHLGRGELETALCAVFFAGQILWLERPVFSSCHPWRASFTMFIVVGLVMLPIALVSGPSVFIQNAALYLSWKSWLLMGLLIIFCTVLSYGIMNIYQKYVEATEAGLIYAIEPVFAALSAMFLPGLFSKILDIHFENQFLQRNHLIGAALIFSANAVLFAPWNKLFRKS